jgi:hypothetical protein
MKPFPFYADAIEYAWEAAGPISALVERNRNDIRRVTLDYYWDYRDGEYFEVGA